MKGLETGEDKVKKICEVLKRETLDPAEQEAEELIATAHREADAILADAHASAKKMADDAHFEIEKQKTIFKASLSQACRQAIEALKESIEHRLFNPELSQLVSKPLQDPQLIAKLITAVIHALEKEGTESDLSAVIASTVSARTVNELLASEVLKKLKEKSVILSTIGGGVEIKLLKNQITIDLTDETIQEMIATYIRKDFREFVFSVER
jgi:V/A-type H+/Na+-transporting ATPase subunit E